MPTATPTLQAMQPTATASALPTPQASSTPPPAATHEALWWAPIGIVSATANNAHIALTTLPSDAANVLPAPDGQSLAFVANGRVLIRELGVDGDWDVTPNTPPTLYVLSDQTETSASPPPNAVVGFLAGMSWSIENRLLFAVDASTEPYIAPTPQLYLVDLVQRTLHHLGDGFAPTWSPDGARMAYLGPPFLGSPLIGGGPGGQLVLADRDGKLEHSPAHSEGLYASWQRLHWSSDSSRLAAGDDVLDATTGTVVLRAPEPTNGQVVGSIVALNNDGTLLSYWRNVRFSEADDPGTFSERDELLLVAENEQVQVVAQTPPHQCPCLPLSEELWPTWAPQQDRFVIAFPTDTLQLYDATGRQLKELPLPEKRTVAGALFWSPDGTEIFATLEKDGQAETWLINSQDGTSTQVGLGRALGWRKP